MIPRGRIAFISQFLDPRWYITIGGVTDDIIVVIPRGILALYKHRRPKK
ncbi:MAG: hypothetical protein IT538_08985 [Variibacter sp.]|nr:hypothetical protein [Variibacter sp.]